MSTTPKYYYVDAQNQAAGPVALSDLQGLQAAGTINDSTLVVVEGGQDWILFSSIKPAPPPASSPSLTPAAAPSNVSPQLPSPSISPSSSTEPVWATQLLQKMDQLALTAEKIVAALEKSALPRQIPTPTPSTASLHAEKISLNPIPKSGIAQNATTPPGTAPRPGVSTPLSPMAVPANAVKPALPLPALGKPVAATPSPAPPTEKSGNLFSKFLKK